MAPYSGHEWELQATVVVKKWQKHNKKKFSLFKTQNFHYNLSCCSFTALIFQFSLFYTGLCYCLESCVTALSQRLCTSSHRAAGTLCRCGSGAVLCGLCVCLGENVGVSRRSGDRGLWIRRGYGDVLLPVSLRRPLRHHQSKFSSQLTATNQTSVWNLLFLHLHIVGDLRGGQNRV